MTEIEYCFIDFIQVPQRTPCGGMQGYPGNPKKSVPIIPRCHGRHHSDLPYVGHSKVNSGRVIPTIFIRPRYQIYVGYSEKVYHVIPRQKMWVISTYSRPEEKKFSSFFMGHFELFHVGHCENIAFASVSFLFRLVFVHFSKVGIKAKNLKLIPSFRLLGYARVNYQGHGWVSGVTMLNVAGVLIYIYI